MPRGLKINRQAVQVLLVVAALAIGGATAGALILAQEQPERVASEVAAPLVKTVRAERQDVPMTVEGYGTVQVQTQSRIVPEVSGRVASVHPELHSGGYIQAGQVLVEIERKDHELALRQAQSELARAEAAKAAAEARITETEARLKDAEDDLARTQNLYEERVANRREVTKAQVERDVAAAQLQTAQADRREAEAQIASARVAIDRAEVNLERTQLTFPFDVIVLNEEVDAGQYIAAGQSVGEVYGTEAVEIPVPLEDSALQWFTSVPMVGRLERQDVPVEKLPDATVRARFAGQEEEWRGRVVRLEGEVDERSRMVRVVVRVDNPLGGRKEGPSLVPGMFVRVEIEGRTLTDVVPLPRHAVHNKDEVWIAEEGRLRMQPVEIARRAEREVYVRSGVEPGERVIVSPIDTVTNGMAVRIAEDQGRAVASDGRSQPGEGRSSQNGSVPEPE